MKKLIALCLALALLYAVPAFAAEWKEGRSPAQPFPGKPAADLSQSLGYIMYYPQRGLDTAGGCRKLRVWLPRTDVKAGHGAITLTCVDDSSTWTVDFNDTDYVILRDMDEDELNYLSWGSGVCFEVTLPISLSQNCDYTVSMAADCIISNDNAVSNPLVEWSFSTDGMYGIWDMEYIRPKSDGSYEGEIVTPAQGDEVRMNVALGGEVTRVVLQPINDDVEFDEAIINESGEATGRVTGPNPSWYVVFYNASNQVVDAVQP